MTTRKTPLPTALRRIALITVAVTMLAVPLTGCDDGICTVCDESIEVDEHTVYDCDVHCEKYYSDDDGLHTTQCEHCDAYLCDGNDHGNGKCVEAPPEPTPEPDPEPTPEPAPEPEPTPEPAPKPKPKPTCPHCKQELTNGQPHTASCGEHYTCESGYSAEEHTLKHACGHFFCNQGQHWQCEYCTEWVCQSTNTHTQYPCGFGTHYACNGYDVAAAGSGTYEHKIFACEEHSDCIALTGLSYSNRAEDHYDCPECWYCVAVGHAPDCKSANQ